MANYSLEIPGCVVRALKRDDSVMIVYAETHSKSASCPSCGVDSKRVHSYYERLMLDLPVGEQTIKIRVRVKRFRCQQLDCKRHTFTESLAKLAERYARRTQRVESVLWHVGQAVGGRLGARLSHQLRIPTSRHQIIRHLRRVDAANTKPVHILGIDDWAKKRGQTDGTILVDLETHCVIDLLPDRDTDTVSKWLQQHPSIEIVTRDRSIEYANGITLGAPQARQIADRWHLLKNLTEMTQRALRDEWVQIRKSQPIAQVQTSAFPRSSGDHTQKELNREQRLKQYAMIQYLKHKGFSQHRIAHLLGLSRGMVRTFYNATGNCSSWGCEAEFVGNTNER